MLDAGRALKEPGTKIQFEESLVVELERDDLTEVGLVFVRGYMTGLGERVMIVAVIEFPLRVFCARCLKEFSKHITVRFEETFVRKGNPQEQIIVGNLDPEENFYEGDLIDLGQSVETAIHLHLPMRFLCKEDCKGLCRKCGVDCNENVCSCFSDENIVSPH